MAKLQQGSVNALILNEKNEILFLKRSKSDEYLPGLWELPGGGIDSGETLEQGLRREVEEECGLQRDIIRPFAVNKYFIKDLQRTEVSFLCESLGDEDIKLSKEHSAYRWVKYQNIAEINLSDYQKKILESAKEYLG